MSEKSEPCSLCGKDTFWFMNICLKATPICNPCATSITQQQIAFWARESDDTFKKIQAEKEEGLQAIRRQLSTKRGDKCPNCASTCMIQVGQDINLYQCDECGHEYPREELA